MCWSDPVPKISCSGSLVLLIHLNPLLRYVTFGPTTGSCITIQTYKINTSNICHHCSKVNEPNNIYELSNLHAGGRCSPPPPDWSSTLDVDRHHKTDNTGTPSPRSPSCRYPPRSSPIGLGRTSRMQRPPYCLQTTRWQTCATPRPWHMGSL
jgi:hypothetical protein